MVLTISDFILLGLSIAGSIFAGIISSFFVQRHFKNKDTEDVIQNVKNVIKEELKDNLNSFRNDDLTTILVNKRTEKTGEVNTKNSKFKAVGNATLTNISLRETSSFESAVKSGNYMLLNKKLRQDISQVYTLMYSSNKQSDLLTELTFVIRTTEVEQVNFMKIYESQKENLNNKHKKLIPLIESLIQKL